MPDSFRTSFTASASVDDVATNARAWVASRIGDEADIDSAGSGSWPVGEGHLDIWSGRYDGEEAFELRWTLPQDGGVRWLVEIAAASTEGVTFVEAAIRHESDSPSAAASPTFRRLGWLPELVEAVECRRDGIRLSSKPTPVTPQRVDAFLQEVLLNPNRTMPVLVISRNDNGQTARDPTVLQRDLVGVALVAVWGSDVSRTIADRLGRPLACYGGGVRIYRPGLVARDAPRRHQYFLSSRSAQPQFGRELRVRLSQIDRELPASERCDEIADRIRLGEREHLLLQVNELTRALSSQDGAVAQREELAKTIGSLQEKLQEATREQERLRDRNARLESALDLAAKHQAAVGESEPLSEPETVAEAVSLAEAYLQHLDLLESAHESAAASRYQQPSRVWEALSVLNVLSQAIADGAVGADEAQIIGWLRTRNHDVSTESEATMHRYGDERQFRRDDGTLVELQLHIKLGGGHSQDNFCRIHFGWNPDTARIEVGHVGRHLQSGHS